MNFTTTNEVCHQQLNESLQQKKSSGKLIQVPSRTHHATSKLEKRRLENLLSHQAKFAEENLAYNSFEEGQVTESSGHKPQMPSKQGAAHHSLSMFDRDVSANHMQ